MASKKYLVPINLLNLSSDPEFGNEGDVYYNTTSDFVKVYTNGSWIPIASEAFSTIAVSGQNNVSASVVKDTLTLVAGTNTTISTNSATNTITISATGNLTSVDSIGTPDYITFDTTPENTPTAAGSVYWSSGDGLPKAILNANVEIGIGQESITLVKNATGSSIAKGKVVYVNGAQGQKPTIALADADTEAASSKTFGITAEAIADGAEGYVVTEGVLRGVNTEAFAEGTAIWLSSTAGEYTATKPTAPVNLVFLGYVIKSNPAAGEIFVKIQNGYELSELHDVLIDGTPADNEVLAYDSTSGLWKNQTASEAGLAALSGSSFTGNISTTGDIAVNGGDITTTSTTASLFDANATTVNIAGAATTVRIGDINHSGTTTIENNLYVSGNITFGGSSTTLSATNLDVTDSIITVATENTADILDIGLVGKYNDGTARYTGLVRDASDSKWKLFKGITTGPTGTVDFTSATYDTLKIGTLEATSVPTVGTITSGTWNGSVISATYIDSAIARLVSPSFTTPSLGVATATSINGTTIPTSKTLLVSTDVGVSVQQYYADLDAIALLTGSTGFLKKDGTGNWSIDTNTYVSSATLSSYAPIADPAFTGIPTAPTAAPNNESTQIATTEYVDLAIAASGGGVSIVGTLNEVDVVFDSGTSTYTVSLPETIVLPSTTSIGDVSSIEIGYLNGLTGPLTTLLSEKLSVADAVANYLTITAAQSSYALITDVANNYQPLDGDLTAIGALTGTTGFLKKSGVNTWVLDDSTCLTTADASSTYLTQSSAATTYALADSPLFTGTVTLPATTIIGSVSGTEIGYLDGVTSSIQTQLNSKEPAHDHPYQTANANLSSIASLAGVAGFVKFDGGSTFTVDNNTYLVRSQPTIDTAVIAGTTTFNLVNAIATTVNFAGAATTLTIGSTLANAATIIRTPQIYSNASTINLFNINSTDVSFAGAATMLNVGGTTTDNSTFNIGANATANGNQKVVNLGTGGDSGSSTIINVGSSNDGTVNIYGDIVVNGTIEVPTPTLNAQAANKGYVDALAAGINIKEQSKYATTAALDVTYAAGASDSSGGLGIGATITATSNGAFSPDGTEVVVGERILVKNQADAKQNGIYVVTDPGDGDSPFILTRASDFNGETSTNGIVKNGDYVFITAGSVNSNASFVVSQSGTSTSPTGAIKFGTDSIVFSQYSGVPGNITSLGVVTQGVWQSTRIQKEYLDTELATLDSPTFTGTVTVPTPVENTAAATKQYVDSSIAANAAALPDIIPLDDIRGQFNGIDSRFQPTFQGEFLTILNPLRLLLSVNGIIQTVDFPEYVWMSMIPREGFMVDSDGYIAFSEVPPAGSTFDARLMPGPNINSVKKGYPFRPVDILLGA